MNLLQICQTIGYTVPQYHNGKSSFISYYVLSIDGQKAIRIRNKLNYIKNAKHRKKYAEDLIESILAKLESGWSPLIDEKEQQSKTLEDAVNLYYSIKEREYEIGEIRKDTIRSIKSTCKIFLQWASSSNLSSVYLLRFSTENAVAFMDYVFLKRKVSAKTYNNYLVGVSTIFNWFIAQSMIRDNPFRLLKSKKVKKKSQKVPLTQQERKKLKELLTEENKPFLLVCLLMYHSGIRRTEMTKLCIEDIDFRHKVIRIESENAKMNRFRYASLPNEVVHFMLELNLHEFPAHYYIVGLNWCPSEIQMYPGKLTKEFAKYRTLLKFHPKTTLYSLRKSGGLAKAENGLSVQAIKDYFGHTSLSSAVTYFENHRSKGNIELKELIDEF